MKVVHIISQEVGGAARAALRINTALNQCGVDSSVLVLHKVNNNHETQSIFQSDLAWNIFRIIRKISNTKLRRYNLIGDFYVGYIGVNILKTQVVQEADVINLHWVNDGMLTLRQISKLSKAGKTLVWTMHDMYSFTAGCYYDKECAGYKIGCNKCILGDESDKTSKFVREQFEKKYKIYRDTNMCFCGCSEWISMSASESLLTQEKRIVNIPNPIDINIFKPCNIEETRKHFNLVTQKKIILFGAVSADSDPRKGFKYLQQIIKKVDPNKYLLAVFGNAGKIQQAENQFEIIEIGKVNSDNLLAGIYSTADVFVAPSIQENLSNTVMEALACGTPVVAFNVGGMRDMIDHKKNGYLAKAFDVDDFVIGIENVIANEAAYSANAVRKVASTFSYDKVGLQYKTLYMEELQKGIESDDKIR